MLYGGNLLATLDFPQLIDDALQCLACCIFGTIGGIVNRIFTDRKAAKVASEIGSQHAEPPSFGWKHDIRGDLVVGAAIGLAAFAFGGDVPFRKLLGAALIGGVSGAAYFNKTKEVNEARRQERTARAKNRSLKKVTDVVLEASVKDEGAKDG
jgi:predicted lipid-binding transport protein (Tim44 family)